MSLARTNAFQVGRWAWLCLAVVITGCGAAFEELPLHESGFDGAVSVIEQRRDGDHVVASVRLPYLDIRGEPAEGRARLVARHDALRNGATLPAFCHVHYEMSVDGAKKWADKGWAVFSAWYDDEAPIAVSPGDGNNLARALIQWARRCPVVNPSRLHLDGGSQGGYMALAMSADMFPVTSATADAPVVNWAYNFAYFEANRPLVADAPSPFESALPVMAAVLSLADMTYQHFSDDLAHDTWHLVSPIAYLNRINHPALITCVTGDMLVPMEQMTRAHLRAHDPARFPDGYIRDFDALTKNEQARQVFEDLLPPETLHVHVEPLQEHSYEITLAMRLKQEEHPKTKPARMERVWRPDRQWNLFYLDEGGPAPFADHFTRAWNTVPDSFVEHYRTAPPAPGILTQPKLARLLERYDNAMSALPLLKDGRPVNRRNFDGIEKRDVLAGLVQYASYGHEHAGRLEALYASLSHKPLGEALDLDAMQQQLETILP